VQQAVAQLLGFGNGQRAVQEQQAGPGEQVAGNADELDPTRLMLSWWDGRWPSPVTGLELGELTGRGVGGEGLEPPAVGVGEGGLRTEVGRFHPTSTLVPSGRPAAVRSPSQPVSSATLEPWRSSPSASIAGGHACSGSARIACCTAAVMVNATENRRSRPLGADPPQIS